MTCDCEGPDRRGFLRELAAMAAGVAGVLQITPALAAALPVHFASGTAARDDEVAYPIPAEDGVTIDKAHEAILVRHEQAVYAFGLSCPHQKTPLRWQQTEGRFQCPKHKSRFNPDGAFIDGRATRNMDRYRIRREAGNVLVDLGMLYQEDKNRDDWLAAVVHL
jgi:nitrite reductase/ring-hydroxylating ferredoxin subunit